MFSRIILFVILVSASVLGQSWTTYNSINSPLASNTIRCLHGYNDTLWVGTDYGLYRLTGSSWEVYTTGNSSLTSNEIRSLLYYNDTLWVGTYDAGLIAISDQGFQAYSTTNSNIPDDFIKDISVDSTGGIWLATTIGLVHRIGTDTWLLYNQFNSPLWSNNISSLLPSDSAMYFGSLNGGLSLLADTNFTVYNSYTSGFPDNTVLDVESFLGYKWCATPSQGLVEVVSTNAFFAFQTENSGISSNALSCVDANATDLYIGTQDQGISIYNNVFFTNFNTANSDLPDNNVLSILAADSCVWIGTGSSGLVCYFLTNSIAELNLANTNHHITVVTDRFIMNEIQSYEVLSQDGRILQKGKDKMIYLNLPSGFYYIQTSKNLYRVIKY